MQFEEFLEATILPAMVVSAQVSISVYSHTAHSIAIATFDHVLDLFLILSVPFRSVSSHFGLFWAFSRPSLRLRSMS